MSENITHRLTMAALEAVSIDTDDDSVRLRRLEKLVGELIAAVCELDARTCHVQK